MRLNWWQVQLLNCAIATTYKTRLHNTRVNLELRTWLNWTERDGATRPTVTSCVREFWMLTKSSYTRWRSAELWTAASAWVAYEACDATHKMAAYLNTHTPLIHTHTHTQIHLYSIHRAVYYITFTTAKTWPAPMYGHVVYMQIYFRQFLGAKLRRQAMTSPIHSESILAHSVGGAT